MRIGPFTFGYDRSVKRSSLPVGNAYGSSNLAAGGLRGFWFGVPPGSKVDYQRLAGDTYRNSIVSSIVNWTGRNLPQASPCIIEHLKDASGKDTEQMVQDHPLVDRLKNPNRYYDGSTLYAATVTSLMTAKGNAYWWLDRNANTGIPDEIWFVPAWQIWPVWDRDATTKNWISGYNYRNNGVDYFLTEDAIIHFRDGLDPVQPRLGLDPLIGNYREITQDNAVSGQSAAVVRNAGVTGSVLFPKGDTELQPGDAENIKAQVQENTTGDNAGMPMVMGTEIDIKQVGISPKDLLMDTAQDRPEARICAALGVNAIVLGLMVGLEHSKFDNMEAADRHAWENGIIPRLNIINRALDTQLLPIYGDDRNLNVGSDFSKVSALAENLEDLFKRNTDSVGGPWMTVNEARAYAGLEPLAGGDELVKPVDPNAQQGNDGGSSKSARLIEDSTIEKWNARRKAIQAKYGHLDEDTPVSSNGHRN